MATLVEWYKDVMNRNDPRTQDWFLVAGPGPLLTIIAVYIYFSSSVGPKFMRDRKPFELRGVMIFYNFLQVLISIYLVYEGCMAGWLTGYKFICEPVTNNRPVMEMRMARAVYMYFLTKLIELLDTVFFVLRKKNSQISFLHVYHHALMPITSWIGVRFFPGGHVTLLGLINSVIHVFMYLYYLLSSAGPDMQKYLWWKRYLTVAQIIQFCIIFVQNAQLVYYGCGYPTTIACLLTINSMLFIYLFSDFYYKAYIKSSKRLEARNGAVLNGNAKKHE